MRLTNPPPLPKKPGTVSVTPENAMRIFYNDIPPAQAASLVAALQFHNASVFFTPTTYAAWTDIPSTFLGGAEDRTYFAPALAEQMLQGARQVEPSAFDVVESCEGAGHSVMVSSPEWTAKALRRAAGEVV